MSRLVFVSSVSNQQKCTSVYKEAEQQHTGLEDLRHGAGNPAHEYFGEVLFCGSCFVDNFTSVLEDACANMLDMLTNSTFTMNTSRPEPHTAFNNDDGDHSVPR